MWRRFVAFSFSLTILLKFSSSFDTDQTASETNITLCSESDGKLLTVKKSDGGVERIETSKSLLYNFVIIDLTCEENEYLRALKPTLHPEDDWEFQNGSIYKIDGKLLSNQEYCFDLSENESNDEFTDVKVCEPFEVASIFTFFSTAMLISLPCLAITFFVYAIFPELRNLHGKSVMFYVLGLMLLYSGLTTAQMGAEHLYRGDWLCFFVGYVTYSGLLISFLWLNIMCIDIWLTFRSQMKSPERDRKRFILFCFYGFGVPAAIVSFSLIVDSTDLIDINYRPRFATEGCWIKSDRLVEGLYIYLPITIINVFNTFLYSITAYKIYLARKETKVLRRGDSQKHSKLKQDKAKFFLYIRLFIIMGAVWSLEPISWFVNMTSLSYVCLVFDILNCSQGIIIFALFIWTPKVRKLITQRYRQLRNLPQIVTITRENSTKISNMSYSNRSSKSVRKMDF